jgi:hypothetical protein
MEREGMQYVRHENCFPWIEDYARAQALLDDHLLDDQLKTDWPKDLNSVARQLNPLHSEMFAGFPAAEYYWSVAESEWATDVGFRGNVELHRLSPILVEACHDQFFESGGDEVSRP